MPTDVVVNGNRDHRDTKSVLNMAPRGHIAVNFALAIETNQHTNDARPSAFDELDRAFDGTPSHKDIVDHDDSFITAVLMANERASANEAVRGLAFKSKVDVLVELS